MRFLLFCLAACALVPAAWNDASAQNVHDFHFSSFEADYYLSKDEDGRARLRVVETMTAEFPEFNQNRGLARAIPNVFEGHTLSFELESVTRNGESEPIYDRYTHRGNVVIETGTNEFLHGAQVYEFAYTIRDVIRDTEDGQEFYWDINGTEWKQRFDAVTARVHLDEAVRALFTGGLRCYEGPPGSARPCGGYEQDNGVITFTSDGAVGAGETVSVVLDFEPDAFELYTEGFAGFLRTLGAFVAMLISLGAAAHVISVRIAHRDSAKSGATVTPQFEPPRDLSALLAGSIYHRMGSDKLVPALIVDLSVRGCVRIIETERKRLIGTSTQYAIELVEPEKVREEEREIVRALFGSLEQGAQYTFKGRDSSLGHRLRKIQHELKESIIKMGYRDKVSVGWKPYVATLLAAGLGYLVIATAPGNGFQEWRVLGLVFGGVGFLAVLMTAHGIWPLTEKGRQVYDYLEGLKRYIKSDEARRLRMLQSPDNAGRAPVDPNDAGQVVELHEKLLPYAMIFGLEKGWISELSVRYDETSRQPHWYRGARPFNAASFSNSLSGMTSSVSHVSAPSGSGGGGAGGGGGGGGGGGR